MEYCFEQEVFNYYFANNSLSRCVVLIPYEDLDKYDDKILIISENCKEDLSKWNGLILIL